MPLASILATVTQAALQLPEYVALVQQVKAMLNEDDQAILQSKIEALEAASDEEHRKSQSI